MKTTNTIADVTMRRTRFGANVVADAERRTDKERCRPSTPLKGNPDDYSHYYFIDRENYSPREIWSNGKETGLLAESLYKTADEAEKLRIFENGNNHLGLIANEIRIRIHITKSEMFKIGELLWTAKKLCQQEKREFKPWIAENFDFSYKTANNFMNVFKYCFGWREFALRVPTSILYEIASPSFPDELRNYLFTQGNIETITNKKFKQLIEKFKKEGLEAIEKDVMEINRSMYVYRQHRYTLDQGMNCLIYLKEFKEKIEKMGATKQLFGFEKQMEWFEPEAREIDTILYTGIKKSVEIMEAVIGEAKTISKAYDDSLNVKFA